MFLPDNLLVKVDRAAMGASLETRLPYLDPKVVELATALPYEMKCAGGEAKLCLRELLSKRVPRELIDREKKGFGIPLSSWLVGPWRDWAEDLLGQEISKHTQYLNSRLVRKSWDLFVDGKDKNPYRVWQILMYLSWAKAYQNA
jgi:asparagine synthase (glutamine-hydrolysing)